MTDHAEEQEMEAEALAAIFDTHFCIQSTNPMQFSIEIYPEMTGDPTELDGLNYVACKLIATLPCDYPENVPELDVELIKGLADEHRSLLQQISCQQAEANMGVPSIFAIAESLREWLAENNVKGLDDVSMHAQMMRKQQQEQKAQQKAQDMFEAQKKQEEMTLAEAEDLAVRKRRQEGTPCTQENFEVWQQRFQAEMRAKEEQQEEEANLASKKKDKSKEVDKSDRITGFEFFKSKATNLEALEAAAEEAENDETALEDLDDLNEELFDEDVDLDELDFDDEDDDDDELDI